MSIGDLTCRCRKDALWNFHQALKYTHAYPVELATRGKSAISVEDVLSRLEHFEYNALERSFGYCSQDFKKKVILPAAERVCTHFDGICLDCMNNPRRKDKEPEHGPDRKQVYDLGCRFKYGEPTWYHSWLYLLKVQEQQQKEQDAERMKELESSQDVSRDARCRRDQSLGMPNGNWIVRLLRSLNGGC
jgi:hypothetical protein